MKVKVIKDDLGDPKAVVTHFGKKEKCEACDRPNESYKYSLASSNQCPCDVSAYLCPFSLGRFEECNRSNSKCHGIHALCRQCFFEYHEEWKKHPTKGECWGFCQFIATYAEKVNVT